MDRNHLIFQQSMRINHKIYKIIDTLPHKVATAAVAAIVDVDRRRAKYFPNKSIWGIPTGGTISHLFIYNVAFSVCMSFSPTRSPLRVKLAIFGCAFDVCPRAWRKFIQIYVIGNKRKCIIL